MIDLFKRRSALLFLFFLSIFSRSASSETPLKILTDSKLILIAEVSAIENFEKRPDWKIITLKPVELLKGSSPGSSLRLLEQTPFQRQGTQFRKSQKYLLFLRELPSYAIWQDLARSGIRYELFDRKRAKIEQDSEQRETSQFVKDFLKWQESNPSPSKLPSFYAQKLKVSDSAWVQEYLSEEIARNIPELDPSLLALLAEKIRSPNFSNSAKISLVQTISRFFLSTRLPTDPRTSALHSEAQKALQSFFCLPPDTVCLTSAETLESQNQKIPAGQYQEAFERAPAPLKTGLLEVIGRNRREDLLPFLEKKLAEEKNDELAMNLLKAIGEIGGERAERITLDYGKDKRYALRNQVIRNLGLLKSVKGIGLLEEALQTKDPALIVLAANALQRIGTKQALEILHKYYERTPHGPWEPAAHENSPNSR